MPREQLEQAAVLIQEHRSTLNTKSSVCSGCNRTHYENFTDFEESKQLLAIIQKLRRFAAKERNT